MIIIIHNILLNIVKCRRILHNIMNVNTSFDEKMEEIFKKIKEHLGLSSDNEVVRFCIRYYYNTTFINIKNDFSDKIYKESVERFLKNRSNDKSS